MDQKNQYAEIVKKVLERAAVDLAEELALAQEIDEDVRLADEREQMRAKMWAQDTAYAMLKDEYESLKGAFQVLKNNYEHLMESNLQLSQQNVQAEQVVKEKEAAITNTMSFLQQSLQNANTINLQACVQLTQCKERISQLEVQLITAKREHVMERARASLLMAMNAPEYVPK